MGPVVTFGATVRSSSAVMASSFLRRHYPDRFCGRRRRSAALSARFTTSSRVSSPVVLTGRAAGRSGGGLLPPATDGPERRHRPVARAERVGVAHGLDDVALG